jgi:arsenate reductase-like glutaredoxin family protein
MIKTILFALLFSMSVTPLFSQEKQIEIVEEEKPSRLFLYGLNKTEKDLDVTITVEGTNFRQSKSAPRPVRIPAASKVLLTHLMVDRGKRANYTYKLKVNDSLSRRAMRRNFEPIKIDPKKRLIIYISENCTSCDTLVSNLDKSRYLYTVYRFSEKPELKDQLAPVFANSTVKIDSVTTPIISLNGTLYVKIEDYDQLLEELNK